MLAAKTTCGNAVAIYGTYKSMACVAKDGTVFVPAQFYNVASKNIGILVITPKGENIAYANTLYAVPSLAEKKAQEMCAAHNAAI